MPLVRKILLTRAEIISADVGITDYDLRKVVEAGALKRQVFAGKTRGKYLRNDVLRAFGIDEGERGEGMR